MIKLVHARVGETTAGATTAKSGSLYPRAGEPVVPQVLLPHLDDRTLSAAARRPELWQGKPASARQALAKRLVLKVEALLPERAAPAWAAQILLPNPAALVRSVPLESRTYTLLRRHLGGLELDGDWTLHQYLDIKGFGARALVDVLCAVQTRADAALARTSLAQELAWIAQSHRRRGLARVGLERPLADDPNTLGTPLLDRAIARIVAALPLTTAHAQRWLLDDGSIGLDQIATAAVRLGRPAPFRSVRCGDLEILVKWNDVDAARGALHVAARMAFDWGIVQIGAVAERLAVTAGRRRDDQFIERVLAAHPDFAWLDQEQGWFWLRRGTSRLRDGVEKILASSTAVPLNQLAELLFRNRPTQERPSLTALENALSDIPGVRLSGAGVVPTQPRGAGGRDSEKPNTPCPAAAGPRDKGCSLVFCSSGQ